MKALAGMLCVAALALGTVQIAGAVDAPALSEAAEYEIKMSGAVWAVGCPPIVRATIKELDGVEEVEFTMPEQVATVKMASAEAELTKEQLEKAFEDTRFKVLEVKKK